MGENSDGFMMESFKNTPEGLEIQPNLPIWFSFIIVLLSLGSPGGRGFLQTLCGGLSKSLCEGLSGCLLCGIFRGLSTGSFNKVFLYKLFFNNNLYIKVKSFKMLTPQEVELWS